MNTFFSIIIAILILLVMITVHEFGHYIVGKALKFKINEFSIGMGPAIFKKRKANGEIFAVRVFPLGGYCAFEGEDKDAVAGENVFNSHKPWQRILVLLAGATMNFLLAIIVISVMFASYGRPGYRVDEVQNVSAYQEFSLQDGDVLTKVNGRNVFLTTDLLLAVKNKEQGEKINCQVLRNGKKINVSVMLRADIKYKNLTGITDFCKSMGIATISEITVKDTGGVGFINGDLVLREKTVSGNYDEQTYLTEPRIYGKSQLISYLKGFSANEQVGLYVANDNRDSSTLVDEQNKRHLIYLTMPANWEQVKLMTETEIMQNLGFSVEDYYRLSSVNYKEGFWATIGHTFAYSVRIGSVIFKTIGELFTGKLAISNVGGPITTVVTTSKMISYGLSYMLEITAFIGVNLAVFNLLPLPALDGSRVAFTLVEWIAKKPVPRKIEAIIHTVGLLLLLGFSVLVDVLQFI